MTLDKQLSADTHHLGKFAQCTVLLHRNAAVPWFILVPDCIETELFDLPPALRITVMDECQIIAKFIEKYFESDKLNFAAIGNVVRQLHIHVIGRKYDDPCWPRPVWGHLEDGGAYDRETIQTIRAAVAKLPGFLVSRTGL